MTTYSIEITREGQHDETVPLTAKTDAAAIQQFETWLEQQVIEDQRVFLAFDRDSDGQHGYINRGGASPTGQSWV